jgi:general secretion pathway protein H
MKSRDYRGFTLLELLVVLVLISILSALVAPRVGNSIRNMTLTGAAQKIAASLRYARSKAVSEKEAYIAVLDLKNSSLFVLTAQEYAGVNGPELSVAAKEKGSRLKIYDLPEGVQLAKAKSGGDEADSGLFQILFFPNGSTSGGWIVLKNDIGRRCRIEVDVITGAVRLGDPGEV